MGVSLEARKLNILEHLAEIEDEAILLQIENLLQPKVDFWDELSEAEKASIQRGMEQPTQESTNQFQNTQPSGVAQIHPS